MQVLVVFSVVTTFLVTATQQEVTTFQDSHTRHVGIPKHSSSDVNIPDQPSHALDGRSVADVGQHIERPSGLAPLRNRQTMAPESAHGASIRGLDHRKLPNNKVSQRRVGVLQNPQIFHSQPLKRSTFRSSTSNTSSPLKSSSSSNLLSSTAEFSTPHDAKMMFSVLESGVSRLSHDSDNSGSSSHESASTNGEIQSPTTENQLQSNATLPYFTNEREQSHNSSPIQKSVSEPQIISKTVHLLHSSQNEAVSTETSLPIATDQWAQRAIGKTLVHTNQMESSAVSKDVTNGVYDSTRAPSTDIAGRQNITLSALDDTAMPKNSHHALVGDASRRRISLHKIRHEKKQKGETSRVHDIGKQPTGSKNDTSSSDERHTENFNFYGPVVITDKALNSLSVTEFLKNAAAETARGVVHNSSYSTGIYEPVVPSFVGSGGGSFIGSGKPTHGNEHNVGNSMSTTGSFKNNGRWLADSDKTQYSGYNTGLAHNTGSLLNLNQGPSYNSGSSQSQGQSSIITGAGHPGDTGYSGNTTATGHGYGYNGQSSSDSDYKLFSGDNMGLNQNNIGGAASGAGRTGNFGDNSISSAKSILNGPNIGTDVIPPTIGPPFNHVMSPSYDVSAMGASNTGQGSNYDGSGMSTSNIGQGTAYYGPASGTSKTGLGTNYDGSGTVGNNMGLDPSHGVSGLSSSNIGLGQNYDGNGFGPSDMGLGSNYDGSGLTSSNTELDQNYDASGFGSSNLGLGLNYDGSGTVANNMGQSPTHGGLGLGSSDIGLGRSYDGSGFSSRNMGLGSNYDGSGLGSSNIGVGTNYDVSQVGFSQMGLAPNYGGSGFGSSSIGLSTTYGSASGADNIGIGSNYLGSSIGTTNIGQNPIFGGSDFSSNGMGQDRGWKIRGRIHFGLGPYASWSVPNVIWPGYGPEQWNYPYYNVPVKPWQTSQFPHWQPYAGFRTTPYGIFSTPFQQESRYYQYPAPDQRSFWIGGMGYATIEGEIYRDSVPGGLVPGYDTPPAGGWYSPRPHLPPAHAPPAHAPPAHTPPAHAPPKLKPSMASMIGGVSPAEVKSRRLGGQFASRGHSFNRDTSVPRPWGNIRGNAFKSLN